MLLSELFADVAAPAQAELVGGDADVGGLAFDSRRVKAGDLYFCVRGETADGHEFAETAISAGAVALVVDHRLEVAAPQAVVPDVRAVMAPAAVRFYGDPTSELQVVGITGTNGKTTSAFLTRTILEATGVATGLLGTVARVIGGAEQETLRTTGEAIDLQADFAAMLAAGDRACVMEVSSHALALGRAEGTRFAIAAFTNLTPEHLDFHPDMEDYYSAKKTLFFGAARGGDDPGDCVVNVDDHYGTRLAGELAGAGRPALTYSAAGAEARLRAESVVFDAGGARFKLELDGESLDASVPIPGIFNVANALCAVGCAVSAGVEPERAVGALAGAGRVPGRFEPIDEGQPFTVLVDYAHTPDSLDNVLAAARELTTGRLITVFGAGGDRDRTKRPEMGRIGSERADLAIITSDNPRSEDPESIVAEVAAGVAVGSGAVEIEVDRASAIRAAVERAAPGDVIVIAGKGHEQGQEFEGGRKIAFDDRDQARAALADRMSRT